MSMARLNAPNQSRLSSQLCSYRCTYSQVFRGSLEEERARKERLKWMKRKEMKKAKKALESGTAMRHIEETNAGSASLPFDGGASFCQGRAKRPRFDECFENAHTMPSYSAVDEDLAEDHADSYGGAGGSETHQEQSGVENSLQNVLTISVHSYAEDLNFRHAEHCESSILDSVPRDDAEMSQQLETVSAKGLSPLTSRRVDFVSEVLGYEMSERAEVVDWKGGARTVVPFIPDASDPTVNVLKRVSVGVSSFYIQN